MFQNTVLACLADSLVYYAGHFIMLDMWDLMKIRYANKSKLETA